MTAKVNEETDLVRTVEKKTVLLSLAPIIVTFLAPAFYLMGLAYHQAYLYQFGVSSDAFPLSITDSYVNAYYACVFSFIDFLNFFKQDGIWSWIIGSILVMVAITFCVHKLSRKVEDNPLNMPEGIKTTLKKLDPETSSLTYSLHLVGTEMLSATKITTIIFTFIIFWVGVTIFGHQKGEERVQDSKNEYLEKGCFISDKTHLSNCHSVLDQTNKIINKGLLIAMNGDRYALFTVEGSTIQNLPSGYKLQRKFVPSELTTRDELSDKREK